jgi:deoxyribodipyrimidine photolyase-related protein
VLATEPGEFRLIAALEDCPIPVHQFPDDRFLCSHAEFEAWAEGRKELRMEWFYREMRRKTGLLMDGDKPEGGKWNYDHDNRKPAPDEVISAGRCSSPPTKRSRRCWTSSRRGSATISARLRPFWFATDRGQARRRWRISSTGALPKFGDYQDAMLDGDRFLYHAVISMYLNAGLLGPGRSASAAVEAYARATRRSTRSRGSSARSSAGANTCAASISVRDRTTCAQRAGP